VVGAAIVTRLPETNSGPNRDAKSAVPLTGRVCEGTPATTRAVDAFLVSEGVTLPQTASASDESLAGTWECGGGEFAFDYSTGVILFIGPSDVADPGASWKLIVDSHPDVYGLSEVHGVTALTADPTNEGSLGGVEFAAGDITVVTNGDGRIELAELLEVAESMGFEQVRARGSGD
jgi:hypothetical protein